MAKETAAAADQALEKIPESPSQELVGIDFEGDAGLGLENVRGKDMAIPYLQILQKGSPQVDDLSEKHIDGAKPGMILNTVTGEIYPGETGIEVVPCGFAHELVEWKPRDSGGGFVGRHAENSSIVKQCTQDERGRLIAPNGNTVMDTKYHFVVLLTPGGYAWAVISMQSTQLKKSRLWATTMKRLLMPSGKEFPSFSHSYRLTTEGETKDKYSWYGWKIELIGRLTSLPLYNYAKDFAKTISAGTVQVSAPPTDEEAPSTEIPF